MTSHLFPLQTRLCVVCALCFGLGSCLLDAGHVGIGSDSAEAGVGPKEKRKVKALTQFGEH